MLDATGRIGGYAPTLKIYDVLSAFSMSYKGQAEAGEMVLSRPVAELPSFPEAVQRRLKRKAPSDLNPWKAGNLAINYDSVGPLSQQNETKNVQKTAGPACEHSDGSEDDGYLYLSGCTERPVAECAQRAIKRNGKRLKIIKGAKNSTTPEAIGRLISGY